MKTLSILRSHQYKKLSTVVLEGSILDLGGNRKSGYHELVKGTHVFSVVNYGELHPGADLVFDAEKTFPLLDASYDHVLAMNFLEHIFNYHNVFGESARVLKKGGYFIANTPFMHHIHGSPNDYHRYTASAYRKLAELYGFEIIKIEPLGYGLFSLIYQCIGRWIPSRFLQKITKYCFESVDKILLHFKKYQELHERIPLGYFWIMKKQ
jgi:SAM-dependent methyltransferase